MSCDNLCTAAKCEELENRISALEQALELLEASFEAHTNQDIPEAHNYEPLVDVTAGLVNNFLTIGVAVDNVRDTALVTLPEPEVDVSLAVDSAANSLKLFVVVGNKNDSETITLPEPEVDVSLAVDSAANSLKLFVAVGNKNDSETITLPKLPVNVTADINAAGATQKVEKQA
jgi:flagellar hook-basal body complex protein FliE